MSYNVVTRQGVRTFEDIDDAGDYAQAMSLRTGEPVKVPCRYRTGRIHSQNKEGNEMKVKKTLMDMIVKWHQAGYALDEIAPLVPQVPKAEVAAIIHQYDKETRL